MSEFQVCGMGNAIVDIFVEVDEADFQRLGYDRGTMQLVEHDEQQQLLSRFHDEAHDFKLVSGGSVANSIIGFSQLGGKAAFIGCVGDDRYGLHYVEEFEHLDIDMGNPVLVGETTGTCVAVITPDAERTMRTCLAVSSHLAARHVDKHLVANSEWLFIEGYVFANPETGQHAVREALKLAKENGTKVALTASDGFIPEVFGDVFREALQQSDLLFCNAPESMAVTHTEDPQQAFAKLKDFVPNAVVTDGSNGAYVRFDGKESHAPAVKCEPKDLTGAGDMFAGAFLYGISNGVPADQAAKAANYMSHKIITQVGARLHHGVKDYWQQANA